MHASGPRACCQCWRECRGGGLNALSIPSCRRGGHCRTTSQPLVRGDLRPHAESPASGFRAWRSPSVQLSGALSRRRRCRTSVSRLRQRKSSPGREREGGGGRGGHVTPPPLSRLSTSALEVLSASDEGWLRCAQLQGLHPGMGSRDRPEAREPESRFRGGRSPHFLCLPGGGAIFARWALKNRKVESGGRARRT